jgi:hypothetical protein
MKNTSNQSFLVLSIVMFFVTTAILMLLIMGDNRFLLVEEAYMLALSIFAGYMVSLLSFLMWKHIEELQ